MLGYRWRYYSLQYLAIIYITATIIGQAFSQEKQRKAFSQEKTVKMAAGCDDFWVIFGIFFSGVLSIIAY